MASFIPRRWNRGSTAAVAGLLLSLVAATSTSAAGQARSSKTSNLPGTYDGGQMEMAVGLRLLPNGRFDYALSYGALDESASGTWTSDRDQVFLTSDPVTQPKFTLVDQRPATDGKTHVVLDLPKGWTRQYFDAEIGLADGRFVGGQLSDDSDAIPLAASDRPVSLRLELGVYEFRSDVFRLNDTAASNIRVRFEPNDLGKVAFAKTPLRIDGGTLTFERYGRSIVFRRTTARFEKE